MFASIARFELGYQLRQPTFWVSFAVFFFLTFFAITNDNIQIGSAGGTHANAPFAITQTIAIMTLFGMFIPVAMMPGTILRDADTSMAGILYSLPITKVPFLAGRFAGAFIVIVLAFLGAPLGLLIGSYMWWLDPEELGPTRLDVYAQVIAAYVVPNLLVMSALFFSVAAITRTNWAVYVAMIGFLVLWTMAGQLIEGPDTQTIEALVDPFGLAASGQIARYWTVFERNSMAIPLEGALLWNRLLWLGVALILLAIAVAAFRFETQARRSKAGTAAPTDENAGRLERPRVTPAPAGSVTWRQLWAQTRSEAVGVLKSPGLLVLLALGIFNTTGALLNLDGIYGTPMYPVTREVVTMVQGAFGLIPAIVVIYYTGELVWRDRQMRIAEIVTACPVPGWVFVMSKLTAVILVLAALFTVGSMVGIIAQLGRGYTMLEPGIYLLNVFYLMGISFLQIAVLAMFIQVLSPNKYIGMIVLVGYLLLTLVATQVGLVDNLLLYGGGPSVPMSDMNGTGHFLTAANWFTLYWSCFGILLMVLSHRLWPGAVAAPLKVRLRALRHGWTPVPAGIAVAALIGFVATGGWIAHNTHGLNHVVSPDMAEQRRVAFEKEYRQYENLPQPSIVDVRTDIDLYPEVRRYVARGTYVLENRTDGPIEEVHVSYNDDLDLIRNELEGGTLRHADEDDSYYIFALAQPLKPGAKIGLSFEVAMENRGFTNDTDVSSINHNGTFINNFEVAPVIGFPKNSMIQDRSTRRKYGLEPIDRMADLDDASKHQVNYLRDDSDWVTFETTVSTAPDQIALAPGYLQREWEENGRRYFHYKMDAPILNFYSWLSARYTVKRDVWLAADLTAPSVELAVYYHEPHDWNVDRMLDSMKKSLAYFSEAFGPYQHRQMRVIEFPAYQSFAQAFPNTVPYSEAIGFIADLRDPEDIDYVFYVTAHEMAHQWWAHQVMGAAVQGSTLLSETLSQYSALMVMEAEYGPDKMRRFLKYELDSYLRGRGGEDREERPIYRVENQQYIHYRKGSLVMYALKDYVGEDVVNRALARLVTETAYRHDPYPTTRDLLRILREEAGPEHDPLITDLFEKITLFDLKVADHAVEKTDDGKWKVTLTLATTKAEADGKGQEMPQPLDQMIDIGLFARDPGDVAFTAADVIYLSKHRIHTDKPVIELIVDREPAALGIDPYNKLIDRNSDDNIVRRTVEVALN